MNTVIEIVRNTQFIVLVDGIFFCGTIGSEKNPIFLQNFLSFGDVNTQRKIDIDSAMVSLVTWRQVCEMPLPVPVMIYRNVYASTSPNEFVS